mmetsp:Transcript_99083/g.154921  ORF Transcript_99083/g.154921 Transcript_99083/m.154921 type:complete len:100 (-) Transcript_99083:65-364(-)
MASSAGNDKRIVVQAVGLKHAEFWVNARELDPGACVLTFKELIQERVGISVCKQRLEFKHHVLQDSDIIQGTGLMEGGRVFMENQGVGGPGWKVPSSNI